MTTSEESVDPAVRRFVAVGPDQRVSVRMWGEGPPRAVLLHGRGQNAHTWDSVARYWGVSLVAVDHPGHGHSDWRADHDYGPAPSDDAIATVIRELAASAEVIVGMSLGGLTLLRVAARYPELVRRMVIVDTTPASRDGRPGLSKEEQGAVALLAGPTVFDSFDAILAAAAEVVTNRPIEALRRGVVRNSRQLPDGRWTWRYDPERPPDGGATGPSSTLWENLSAVEAPIMLVRSGRSHRIEPADIEEFLRRQPTARIELVEDAGHSIQSDQPVLLTDLIKDFIENSR